MSATNGLTRSFRLLGCLMAVALLASAMFASSAFAKKEPTNPTAFINMGDSVSYGYSNEKFVLNFPSEPPSAFEGGYANLLGAKLAKKEASSNNKLAIVNLACPGEKSTGLIGNGPVAEALEAKKEENGFTGGGAPCGWHNSSGFERHTEYGTVSQLEAAIGTIEAYGAANVKDVTLQIGSNDELQKLGECSNPTYLEAHGFMSFLQCVEVEAATTLFPTIIRNIGLTIGVLRNAGYAGPIGVLGFYNPQAFLVPTSDLLQKKLNEALEATIEAGSYGPKVAYGNPFKKINPQGKKSQTANQKKLAELAAICNYTEECNPFDRKLEAEKANKTTYTAEEWAAIEANLNMKFEKEEPGGKFLPGDIHPTPAGQELFSKLLGKALKKAA
ncbi:MAG TPA: hypothetical protein VIB59_01385 [Solirubrobacteraceae bacterium]|jgi:hypothetical protein